MSETIESNQFAIFDCRNKMDLQPVNAHKSRFASSSSDPKKATPSPKLRFSGSGAEPRNAMQRAPNSSLSHALDLAPGFSDVRPSTAEKRRVPVDSWTSVCVLVCVREREQSRGREEESADRYHMTRAKPFCWLSSVARSLGACLFRSADRAGWTIAFLSEKIMHNYVIIISKSEQPQSIYISSRQNNNSTSQRNYWRLKFMPKLPMLPWMTRPPRTARASQVSRPPGPRSPPTSRGTPDR